MEPKESKSSTHFRISMVKSLLRIIACYTLLTFDFQTTAILFCSAEVLGIVEEL
jgi:hypothetical protein